MPQTTILNRRKVAPGIRRDQYGFEAYVKVAGKQVSKRFEPDTSLRRIEYWRQSQIREVLDERIAPRRIPPTRKSLAGWCYVYVARAGEYLKIGRAIDVAERLRNMQAGQAERIQLLVAIPSHSALEAAIHERFANARHRGEWFLPTTELMDFVKAMQQEQNPVAWLFEHSSS
jgi:hypothetical protein